MQENHSQQRSKYVTNIIIFILCVRPARLADVTTLRPARLLDVTTLLR